MPRSRGVVEGGLESPLVVGVWFPAEPLLGAAVAANLAALDGGRLLVDCEGDWTDAAAALLDDAPPVPSSPDEVADAAVPGAGRSRVVAFPAADPALGAAIRTAGGGVVALPASLAAATLASELDCLILGVARNFLSVRRARLALDALPVPHRQLCVALVEGLPSDLRRRDVELALGHTIDVELPSDLRPIAASVERGQPVPGAGPWGYALGALSGHAGWTSPQPPRGGTSAAGRWLGQLVGGRR